MIRGLPGWLAALALCAAWPLGAQQPSFRVETRLVVLHATVRNGRGELITSLDRRAFTVYENGKAQPIALFRRDDIPVSVGLVIDNSGSMRTRRGRVEAAALAFARASNRGDELFVMNFADKVRLDVPMTGDLEALESGIGRVDAIGGTAMRDAVADAEAYLDAHAARDRKVLLIISDGRDNASVATLDRVRTAAEQRGITVYAIGLVNRDDPRAREARRELDRLTAATGGLAYYPATPDAIDAAAIDIARQIRNQYTIAYTPLEQALDGSYRRIRVEAKGSEKLVVIARAGYRATPDALSSAIGR